MTTAHKSASAAPTKEATSLTAAVRRILASPVKTAVIFAVAGRLIYSSIAALYAPYLHVDPTFVNSNRLTDALIPQAEGWKYALLGVWERFDTLWYVHIARFGYDRPEGVVFFPLYPLLMALSHLPPLFAGLLISTVASFFFAYGLLKLAALDNPPEVGRRALLLYFVWPAGFILFAAYPESLLLCFVVWAIYFARVGNAFGCAAATLLAGATKSMGAVVFVPIAFLAIRQRMWKLFPAALAAAVVPVAMTLWLQTSIHMNAQQVYAAYWGTKVGPPWQTLWAALIVPTPFGGLNTMALCLVLLFAFLGRVEYSLFASAVLWVVLSKQTLPLLESTSRYVMLIFPAFLNAARLLSSRRLVCFALTSAIIAFIVFERFLNWRLIV